LATSEHYDTIIIGGGVGGGTAAKFLTKAQKRSVVLEAGDMPRWSETCSGIFGETFRILEQTPEAYPGEIIAQDKQQIRIFFGGRTYGSLPQRWTKPLFNETLYFTLRGELEAWILSQSDASVRPNTRVRSQDISYHAGGSPRYRVRTEGVTYTSDFLVGAGGTHCPVRRAFFPNDYLASDLVVLREAEVHENRHHGLMLNYFYFDDIPGFAWLYPKGANGRLTNLGICCVGEPNRVGSINPHWKRFVAHLKAEGLLDPSFKAENATGSSLYLHQSQGPVRANADTCFLVGDAAALTQRDFWNGITPSCLSGKLAARHIAGLEEYSREKIHPYLFRFSKSDSPLQRRVRDELFRTALPALHRFMARRAPNGMSPRAPHTAPIDEAAS
jgi:flavin-dependent dehydrogenase